MTQACNIKLAVGWACATLTKLGVNFEYDTKNQCWDVETPDGWETAHDEHELCRIARSCIVSLKK
jgi:hypothetical protein